MFYLACVLIFIEIVFAFIFSTMQSRLLFDGAFQCLLPTNVIDASDLRQIPDNQEIFVHPSTSQSITIDIMEYVDANNREEAASSIIHSHSPGHNPIHLTHQHTNGYSTSDSAWSQDKIDTTLHSLRLINSNIFTS
ncbi:Ran guanine nucleotide release factor [Schistosoma japonicum]|nr:Ran guanine nucleotide release factor [Schistosoma japonicum]KAH8860623.1 Ran guanine nucleotide release factor [Schistosoma japonicum]KAH8860624.1 Ran guanine nucleotide release factor [Schistosoma japonicum]